MAGTRKLQSEIAQVMKKIEEGMSDFDDIWEKVYAAETQSHKERWEAELKKEIKKLQRFRDQIKGWMSSPEIKDKAPLLEARKNVESKMEQFKICERETKTKAYSREGLARAEKIDPRDAEKEEKRNYLNEMTEKLNELVESLEADYEKLGSSAKKGKNKEAADKLNVRIRKNRWNVFKLEQIKRLLDNDELEPSALDDIRDDIDYYVESAQESDHGDTSFEEMLEYNIYEPLNLDTNPITAHMSVAAGIMDDGGGGAAGDEDDDARDDEATTKKGKKLTAKQQAAAKVAAAAAATTVTAPTPSAATAPPVKGVAPKSTAAAIAGVASIAPVTMKPSAVKVTAAVPVPTVPEKRPVPVPAAPVPTPVTASVPVPVAAEAATPSAWGAAKSSTDSKLTAAAIVAGVSNMTATTAATAPASAPPAVVTAAPLRAATVPEPLTGGVFSATGAASSAPDLLRSSSVPSDDLNNSSNKAVSAVTAAAAGGVGGAAAAINGISQTLLQTTLAAAPSNVVIPPRPVPTPLSQDLVSSLNMLNCSMSMLPQQSASSANNPAVGVIGGDRSKFVPRTPFACHPSFPTTQPASSIIENPKLFERLSYDTLFLAFYYQQGSYQQYLAAKQLKKHSWRYHRKYLTWFQRHEEPKSTTDEYEEGTYVYFDYENGWCQRIKPDFKFEYAYLENEL